MTSEKTLNLLAPSGSVTLEQPAQQSVMTTQTINLVDQKSQRIAKQGNLAWSLLHRYRGCDPQWLELWVYFIPRRCDCKDGYQKILEEVPPDFTSPEAFFAWGVRLHNAVNAKLGKPEITIEDAYSIWRKDNANTENSASIVP